MVSGLVTSPLDHERICFEEARPIEIASKLLMSIIGAASVLFLYVFSVLFLGRFGGLPPVALGLDLLLVLVGRVPQRGADPREVDAQLLGRTQQVVVLVADLDPSALLGLHV